ncbi:MAG: DUF1349 domain-containing protein [Chloroflexota bacterium]
MLVAHHVDAKFGTVTVDLNSVASAPKLTTGTSGTGSGTIAAVPNKTTFKFGEDVSLTATAADGSTFTDWVGDVSADEANGNVASFEMFSNRDVTAVFTDPNVVTPVSDDFSSCVLDEDLWTYYNPLGDANLSMTGSQVQIVVPQGQSHDYWTSGTDAPRIMQPVENKDFQFVTKFESALSAKTQMQGVIVEQDANNWLRFNIGHNGNSYEIVSAVATNGSLVEGPDKTDVALTPPMYLRVTRAGDVWTLEYSSDGQSWTIAETYTQVLTASSVGVFAGNAGKNNSAPLTTVLVDYFFNTAQPIDPEDAGAISLQVNQQGSGSVSIVPLKQNYACGEVVSLTALPAIGWKFSEWQGGVTGTDISTTITMNKSEVVTAVFVPDAQYALTLTANGNGAVAKEPDKALYGAGESVKLTATADLGYQFTGWTGDLTTPTNPVTITMDITKTITGNFSPAPNRTLATSVPGGGGTIGVNPLKGEYLNGETVTLTATPVSGYSFVGWGGDLAGETASPIQLVMDSDKSVTAVFAQDVWSLNVIESPDTGGNVTRNPNKSFYYDGEVVELTAVPSSGLIFLGWTGDLDGTANPASVTMTKNTVITATFAATGEFTLTTAANGPGQVSKNPNQPQYSFGDAITLTATADPGYAFIGWRGDLDGHDNPAVVSITQDMVVTATFTLDNLYTLAVTPIGNGQVTKDPVKAAYAQDEPVLLTAVPNLGYRFTGWSGDLTGTINPATVIMTGSKVISATFEEAVPVQLTIDEEPDGTGFVVVDPQKDEYLTGEIVTLTAKAMPGYAFSGWQGDASGNESPYQLVLDADKTVTATFTDQPGATSDDFNACSIDPMWNWVDPTGFASYEMTGTEVRMIIPPGENYNLGTGGNYAARLMQPVANTDFVVEAKFDSGPSAQYQYQGILVEQDPSNYIYFQFYSDGSGDVKAYAGSVENNVGKTRVNKIVNVNQEMALRVRRTGDTWKLDFSVDGTTWTKVGSNFKHEIKVNSAGFFAGSHSRNNGSQPGYVAVVDYFFNSDNPIVPEDLTPPAVNVTVVGSGSVSRDPDQATYACGDQVTLTATPDTGSVFSGWSGGLTGSNPIGVVTVNGVVDVTATFVPAGGYPFKTYLPSVHR